MNVCERLFRFDVRRVFKVVTREAVCVSEDLKTVSCRAETSVPEQRPAHPPGSTSESTFERLALRP